MTETDVNTAVLVDTPPDEGIPENQAWVQVTAEVATPQQAVALLKREFPLCERDNEEETYVAAPDPVWLKPPRDESTDQWRDAEEGAPGAREFWAISVVCNA